MRASSEPPYRDCNPQPPGLFEGWWEATEGTTRGFLVSSVLPRASQDQGFCGPWSHSWGSGSRHRSDQARPRGPRGRARRSWHKPPPPPDPFPLSFSHSPTAFCLRLSPPPLWSGASRTLYHCTDSLPLGQTRGPTLTALCVVWTSGSGLPGKFFIIVEFQASAWTYYIRFCIF